MLDLLAIKEKAMVDYPRLCESVCGDVWLALSAHQRFPLSEITYLVLDFSGCLRIYFKHRDEIKWVWAALPARTAIYDQATDKRRRELAKPLMDELMELLFEEGAMEEEASSS